LKKCTEEKRRYEFFLIVISDSQSPSPASVNSASPSPTCELTVESQIIHKDSPTADRDSLHIEMVVTSDQSHLASGIYCTKEINK
jgi:hypothetical protein